MTKVTDKFLYGELLAEVQSAAGVKGVLIRTAGERNILDHSPPVLGLKKIGS